ncbi:hypothetical protein JP75_23065 [Devosia riboflavina]|uniref:Uncharacterized protein n=1 Tax=Devosia riboflavina TaxID=46914 RepID=A0A087LWW2_9HYPH|nr:hypothetical protein [Devosia riboflavina]KFL29115.1 hypothetical protein JP75_23065 [Devosia riboflavina]
MAVETLFVSLTKSYSPIRPRWQKRLIARYRLWRMGVSRELQLGGLGARRRADIGRPEGKKSRWLDELMRSYRMR